jgi:hypothetical protein
MSCDWYSNSPDFSLFLICRTYNKQARELYSAGDRFQPLLMARVKCYNNMEADGPHVTYQEAPNAKTWMYMYSVVRGDDRQYGGTVYANCGGRPQSAEYRHHMQHNIACLSSYIKLLCIIYQIIMQACGNLVVVKN